MHTFLMLSFCECVSIAYISSNINIEYDAFVEKLRARQVCVCVVTLQVCLERGC